MYYKLTKEDYKKNDKEFRKTYIGKNLYLSIIVSYILSIWNAIPLAYESSFNYKITEMTFWTLLYLIFFIISLILGAFSQFLYIRELKEYITTKK